MTTSFFALLADRVVQFHRLILLFASVLTIVSILLITQLHMDSSLDSLMPSRDNQARKLLTDLMDAGPQDVLVVVVSVSEPGELESAKELVDVFVEKMASFPGIDHVEARVSTEQKKFFSEIMLPHAGLYLSEKERLDLLERLSDSTISRQIKENKRLLLMPMQSGVRDLILKDPLGLRYLWLSRWFAQQSFAGLELDDGYLVDKSRSHLLVFIRPKESARNITYTKRLMAAASAAGETAISNWRKSHPAVSGRPKITFAGGYAIAQEDEALTRRDLQSSLLISFLGVNILFFLVFRKLRFLFLMLLPLAMALIWTFGLMQLIFGHVNVLTGAFAAVLLGLGIDFAIHLLNLYLAACQNHDQTSALHLALTQSGRAILMGGLTTALAFFALSISSFRGFQELGIITGIGILACLTAMLVVLPALLVWHQGRAASSVLAKPIPTFGLNYLIRPSLEHPRWVVWPCLFLLAAFGIAALDISFEDDLRSLRPQEAGRMAVEKEVESILGGASGYVLLVTEGKDEDTLLNKAWRLDKALAKLEQADRLSHYRSILAYWPAPESQRLALDFYQRYATELNPDRIEATFKKALQENGFQFLPEYTSYLNWLRTLVNPHGRVDRQTFKKANLEQLLDPFLVERGPNRKLFTFVFPREGLWDKNDLAEFSMDLSETALESGLSGNDWRLAGWPILTDHLKGLVWRDLAGSLVLAGLAIAVALLLALRHPFYASLAAIPLVGGIVALLGIMALLTIKFNYVNFIVLPLIVGIGIDDGIHIVHHWRQDSKEKLSVVLNRIGRAIVLTSLTTTIGFGSLVSSHYPGLRSIGWVTALGILTCLLAALFLLPAVLAWIDAKRTASPKVIGHG
jgi:predicted RND superfamily exporter protein